MPEGISRTQISRASSTGSSISMSVPGFVAGDRYFIVVKPLWINATGQVTVQGEDSDKAYIDGLVQTLVYAGVVNNDEGAYVGGATVTLTETGSGERRSATANRWGLFRVENIKDPEGVYTVSVTAPGYRPVSLPGVTFSDGDITDAEIIMHPSSENELDLGIHTGLAECGPADLMYKASDTETIYPSQSIALPEGAKILSVAYDGVCGREKNVKVSFTLHGENCFDESYSESSWAADISNLDFLAATECKIPKGGTEVSPAELLKFSLDEPYPYTGGALRLRVQARASGFVNASFSADATRKSNCIRRIGDSEDTLSDWELSSEGMPVARISYIVSSGTGESLTDGVSSVAIEGGKGFLTLRGNTDSPVTVSDINGRVIATVSLTGTPVTIKAVPGVYLCTGGLKAIVF